MQFRFIITMLLAGVIIAGCSGEGDSPADLPAQDTQASEDLFGLPGEDSDMAKAMQAVTERRDARRAKGDTTALPAATLKQYLPASIAGYTSGTPSTEQVSTPGMSLSRVSTTYTSQSGVRVTMTLVDYNASASGWESATAVFALPISVENDSEVSKTFQTDDALINGFESLKKATKDATVIYSLGGRFVLEVTATNQTSLETARSIAAAVDLKKLAGL
jgi:hypothetical protein